ncbi:hypothetical protein L9F63_001837 [Diploptera punctata]|uniref:aspartate transaminase n=1 Tax=Diploptera punctata TaxID=6984 RepID=A0AAD8A549_DIPPU|nr:hypothetical protein L9F63_001837 [Diploptera punctata]
MEREESRFSVVNIGPPIEGSAIFRSFLMDDSDTKVYLGGGGVYRSEQGKPVVLDVVKNVKKRIVSDAALNHEYLPELGLDSFTRAATELLLGPQSYAVIQGLAFSIQCIGSTGALRIGADFLRSCLQYSVVYCSNPSPEKHNNIFMRAGFTTVSSFRYWKPGNYSVDMEGLLNDLNEAPKDSVIILQVCGHNPTGCDPTRSEWMQIADIIEKQQLFPFFECYSLGLASGNIDVDAWPVRYFADRGFEFMCTQSFSANFGLYNERVGNLTFVVKDASVVIPIRSQFSLLARESFSSPSSHGALIVANILNNHELRENWKVCLYEMSKRILDMRQGLQDCLERFGTPGKWNHLSSQSGMFSYTELSHQQVDYLSKSCHVYLPKSGCINICGLNEKNLKHVAISINQAVIRFPRIEKN